MDQNQTSNTPAKRTGRWKLFAVLLVCASPLIAVLPDLLRHQAGRPHQLRRPARPAPVPDPAAGRTTLDGKPAGLERTRASGSCCNVGSGDCEQACQDQLFAMRQLRLMQGKDMDRVERVWLVTDDDAARHHADARDTTARTCCASPPDAVAKWLPVEQGGRCGRPHLPDRPARQPDDALPERRRPGQGEEGHRQAAQSFGDRLTPCRPSTTGAAGHQRPAGGEPAAGDGVDVVRRQQVPQAGLGDRCS